MKSRNFEQEIQNSIIEVDHTLSKDISDIIGKSDSKLTPFMEFLWQEQKKLLK